MKFKAAVIAILAVILGVNVVGVVLTVQETKEQTELAQKTAELTFIQTRIIANNIANNATDDLDTEEFNALMKDINQISKIGNSLNNELLDYLIGDKDSQQ